MTTNVTTKEIQFHGDKLLGVQDQVGNIYLAVSKTAMNIGLNQNQADAEVKKVKSSELFDKHWFEHSVKFDGQHRNVIVLLEKYVPMWLAQINITPKMKLQNPDAANKLLLYQEECVEILHKAFMGDEDKRASFYERFDLQMEEILSHKLNEFITPLNNKIISLEEHVINSNKSLDIANEQNTHLQYKVDKLEETVANLNNKFKISYNKSAKFEKLKIDFLSAINYHDTTSYVKFYENLENWLGYKFPKNNTNTKQWIIKNIDMDIIEEFVNGVIIGRIVKSKMGNWVDLSGIYENQVEFEKVKAFFQYSCAYCGIQSDVLDIEHIVQQSHPKSTNEIKNVVCACKSCNKSKYNLNFKGWYLKQPFYTKERLDAIHEHWNKYRTV